MPTQLQLRRGNTAQTAVFTGALAEITVDTTRQTLIIHDGVTAGGTPLATLAFAQAAFDSANNVTPQVQPSFNQANAAFLKANSAYASQNTTGTYANAAYTQANTGVTNALAASSYANSAFAVANSAGSYANSAFTAANSAGTNATSAYNFATAVNLTATAAYNQANTATTNAATADSKAVTAGSYANSAYTQANTATTNAATADSKAVTAGSYANSAYTQANTATTNAATADSKAVTAGSYANSAYTQANTATTNALAASTYANAAFIQANAVYQYANTLSPEDNVARYTANSAALYANGAFVQANGAFTQANAAFTTANNALPASGGTITGSLTITQDATIQGNLNILGSSTTINTSSFTVNDSLLTLGIGNYTSDALDIGFAAHYNNGTNAHTGIIRDSGTKEWLFFEGYTPELTPNNNIVITDPSFTYANTVAKTFKGNVIGTTVNVNGYDAFTYITNAYTQANTGVNNAAGASLYANGAFIQANAAYAAANAAGSSATVTAAFLQANSAFIKANSAYVRANNSLNANTGGTVAGPIVVDNGSYGNVTITQFASVWGQASGPNAYSIVQTRSNDNASGIGMQAYAASNGLLFANTGIQFNTGVTLRDKDYPTGGTNAGQFAANGAFISQASIASTSNSTGSIQVVGGVGVKGNVYADAVYVNGVGVLTQANAAFLQANSAYTTANNALPKAGGQLTGNVVSSNVITASALTSNTSVTVNSKTVLTSNTYTTNTSNSQVSVDAFATTDYRTAKYLVQMSTSSNYHATELILIHDGTTVTMAQYGELYSNTSLGSFDASISSGTVNLLFTPTGGSNTYVDISRTAIPVANVPTPLPDITGTLTIGYSAMAGYGYDPGNSMMYIPSWGSRTSTPSSIISSFLYNTNNSATQIKFATGTYSGVNGSLVVSDSGHINSATSYRVKIGNITQTLTSSTNWIEIPNDVFNIASQNGTTVNFEITLL